MSSTGQAPELPDLRAGIPDDRLKDHGMFLGQVDGEPVLLLRRGAVVRAVQATCTHYGTSLADGVVVGETIRCPLHHACFDLSTGQALRAPALGNLTCYEVERRLDLLVVRGRIEPRHPLARPGLPRPTAPPQRVVIVGAGAAGTAAALALREAGFAGQLTLIGQENEAPYDRPNLSKDYLAGTAPEEWLPLVPRATYEARGIRLTLGVPVLRVDAAARTVWLADGRAFPYDALLLATGATPVRPPVAGAERPHVHTLRSLDDAKALRERAVAGHHAVIVGGGFIGMEAAAALIQAGMAVHVVAREQLPLVRALGPRLGQRLRTLHESHGVAFHGERALTSIRERSVTVDDGSTLDADLVILATGVRPNTEVAAAAGLALDQGILVDRYLETSVPGIYAAGDAARWPDPNTGVPVRFEHWATAERQGQTAARNMLGALEAFETIPFFWTQQYDVRINYVGYASWDRIEVRDGLPPDQWEQHHSLAGKQVGLATIGRDSKSLSAELALEHGLRTSRPAPVRPVRPRADAGSLT